MLKVPGTCCGPATFHINPVNSRSGCHDLKLADLGITHRRIPVNAIGRDIYADNRAFLEAV